VGDDDARALAKRYLGDAGLYWVIEDANNHPIRPGSEIIIPLQQDNPTGVTAAGYQTVPILCYHRFGDGNGRLTVSARQLREQLSYLKAHDYRVIPLQDLIPFLRGERPLPKRAVVLTIDDGHRSIYHVAYPILKEFGFPATIFVYSDYLNNGGLTWKQLDEMVASGLISIQPHSKTHDNLTLRHPHETEKGYVQRIKQEVRAPTRRLKKRFGEQVNAFAYPYGDANDQVMKLVQEEGLTLGLTVQSAANPAFSYPYLLHRSMIFGDRDMAAFKALLETFKSGAG
jgi:peptidoglycan/xylan/chitin deacetylase (PgdA/CDA1 family)